MLDEKAMTVMYVMVGLDLAIDRGWLSGGPFATETGRDLIDSWLTANVPPTDNEMLLVLAWLVSQGRIDLGGGSLGGQKAVGIEDFLTLIKGAWEKRSN